MCTVTWLRQPDGYALLCNRDELDTRRPAVGPRGGVLRGVSFIAPTDGDHGGSWIGVNEFGLTLCLLNRYGDPATGSNRQFISRGLLLTELIDCQDAHEVIERLAGFQFNRFRPFSLLLLHPQSEPTLLQWTSRDFDAAALTQDFVPLTSTALNEPGVAILRRQQYEHLKRAKRELTISDLQQFHRSHLPERGAYSVCMHRDGAATVSLSVVTVNSDEVSFSYTPGSPCENTSAEIVSIPKRQ